ncbi:MAG: hypothetical protein CBC65_001870 [Rhodothermaceae bacterium TMED105]|jgi:lysophospholipase L1-like esterase|nr:MAG: hypothetical protein CBC65_001870 [Rhodothermaceae bacterium TMED105]|tara:strand:- start:3103 stop:3678 length:576 start_codon:yes stop_codon:yes gene_type:complete
MNRVFHIVTNAGEWQGSEILQLIDERLIEAGSNPIFVDWDGIEMDDPDHFTNSGAVLFASRLVDKVAPCVKTETLHVITDSTVDYNDWSENGVYTRESSKNIIDAFRKRGITATIDAISGSGFVARAVYNEHFRKRVVSHLTTTPLQTTILLMGGWNDVTSGHPITRILNAIASCVNASTNGVRSRPLLKQ